MNRFFAGLLFGAVAGVIDVVPMVLQGLSWDANLSAFCLWVVVGFFIATSRLTLSAPVKGILIAFLVLAPAAILIGWNQPVSLLPIAIMTLILGGLLGYTVEKISRHG